MDRWLPHLPKAAIRRHCLFQRWACLHGAGAALHAALKRRLCYRWRDLEGS